MTPEQNERLSSVGPGTPSGEMLRRYWWPIGFSELVTDKPLPVRLLGEDLVMFRDGKGDIGLLGRRCAHRGTSLEFGRVESDGLRCCYHGWKFAKDGRCTEMPAEPENSPLLKEVKQKAYATYEAGGLIFAYIGPSPIPLFPPYDLYIRPDCNRVVSSKEEHCNWLQRAENGYDPYHSMALHAAGYPQIALKRPNVTWEETWYGCRTLQQYPGKLTNITHQIFPSHSRRLGARVGDQPRHYFSLRVPTDDVTTTSFYIQAEIAASGPYKTITRGHEPSQRLLFEPIEDGWWRIPSHEQDRIAQESQGILADRTSEFLATSDQGIVMFRRMMEESIQAVEQGRDPLGVIREPDQANMIRFDAGKNYSDGLEKPPDIIMA
jgi:5,5'-dehydrodivanillate O-demethylase